MLKLFLYLDIKCKWASRVASATLLTTCSQHFCVSSKDGVGVGAPWPLPGPFCRAACPGTLPLANLTSVLASCMCCGQLCGRASSSWLALPGCPIGSSNDTCPKWNSPQAPFSGMDPQTPVSRLRTHTATPLLPVFTPHLRRPGTPSWEPLFRSLTFVLGFEVVSHGSLWAAPPPPYALDHPDHRQQSLSASVPAAVTVSRQQPLAASDSPVL